MILGDRWEGFEPKLSEFELEIVVSMVSVIIFWCWYVPYSSLYCIKVNYLKISCRPKRTTVMITSVYWWLNHGDSFIFWWQNHNVGDISRDVGDFYSVVGDFSPKLGHYIKSFLNIINRRIINRFNIWKLSLAYFVSKIHRQHRCSPTENYGKNIG